MQTHPAALKVAPVPIGVAPRCGECRQRSATVFTSDRRYRCGDCHRAWTGFARRIAMTSDGIVGTERRRFR